MSGELGKTVDAGVCRPMEDKLHHRKTGEKNSKEDRAMREGEGEDREIELVGGKTGTCTSSTTILVYNCLNPHV